MGPLLLQVLLNVRENGFIVRVDTISSHSTFLKVLACSCKMMNALIMGKRHEVFWRRLSWYSMCRIKTISCCKEIFFLFWGSVVGLRQVLQTCCHANIGVIVTETLWFSSKNQRNSRWKHLDCLPYSVSTLNKLGKLRYLQRIIHHK